MSDFQIITAEVREDVGKGASRRLRHEGKIPAVLYGGDRDPVSLTLEHDPVLHASENEAFYSSILEVRVGDGRKQQVVLRDMHRHPFKPLIMHVDFMRVDEKQELKIAIPLHFKGEEESPAGRTSGVIVQHLVTEVEVSALPKDLPEYLEVDLSDIDAGESVLLTDIILPEGVTVPALAQEDADEVQVAIAVHIKESQGTGAAAEAEAEADEELSAEVPTVGEDEAEAEAADDSDDGDES